MLSEYYTQFNGINFFNQIPMLVVTAYSFLLLFMLLPFSLEMEIAIVGVVLSDCGILMIFYIEKLFSLSHFFGEMSKRTARRQ